MSQTIYTLQPVAYDFPPDEQKKAQFSLWKASNRFSPRTLAILGAIVTAALAGLYFTNGYSTAVFWLMLVSVAAFAVLKQFGLPWYVKKQIDKYPVQEVSGMKMGVQPQGIVLIQKMGSQEGRGMIEWKDIKEWRETPDYLFLFFNLKGQQGAHVIPKSFADKKFPVDTVRQHLLKDVGPAATGTTRPYF